MHSNMNVNFLPNKFKLSQNSIDISGQQWTEPLPLALTTLNRIIIVSNNENYEILIFHGYDDTVPVSLVWHPVVLQTATGVSEQYVPLSTGQQT
jgi:hypothetical protein